MEIIAYVVGFYFVCVVVSAIMPRDNQIGKTAGSIKGLMESTCGAISDTLEELDKEFKAHRNTTEASKRLTNTSSNRLKDENIIDAEIIESKPKSTSHYLIPKSTSSSYNKSTYKKSWYCSKCGESYSRGNPCSCWARKHRNYCSKCHKYYGPGNPCSCWSRRHR